MYWQNVKSTFQPNYTSRLVVFSCICTRIFLKYDITIKGPGTALIETEPFQVYTNENHS